MPHPTPDQCADILKALGEPVRLRVLTLLQAGPRTVAQVAEALGIPPYKASRHLSALAELGVIVRRREGRKVVCALAQEPPVLELGCCSLRLEPGPDGP